ncbi:winged helix-turn-helix transcriptional regulator [Corynebacterium canis]|uniref:Winged helix-turn-helix transcriptional regulator n=1 Tax=Corynebacterium canis TaxID=679663 RepID=A0A5C5UJR6_9CORY|nr:metalloregulator ArsR/SmtB family transcription factor [Corynebacterium canis]TWT25605.1 winged helix-turn-helix transcriptional regulator [Corynebacterium canis]WJY74142.1 Arsenical resistance operon repressor [Corynebacterium canis]
MTLNASISHDLNNRASLLFKALSDPTRLRLLYLVADGGDICSCDLSEALQVSAPTVTHHMKKLSAAGLVQRQQRGKWAHYKIIPETFYRVDSLIREM